MPTATLLSVEDYLSGVGDYPEILGPLADVFESLEPPSESNP